MYLSSVSSSLYYKKDQLKIKSHIMWDLVDKQYMVSIIWEDIMNKIDTK